MGTCWAVGVWAANTWAANTWAAAAEGYWKDGLYFMIDMGGGVIYLKQL